MSVSHNRPPNQPSDASGSPSSPGAEETDETIISRTLEGEAEAFDILISRYAPRLTRMAYGLVNHHQDAEDLVQEALANAFFKLDSFGGRSSFFTWIYRITVNLSISKHRKRRIETTRKSIPLEETITSSNGATPDSVAETEELVQQMRQAIAQLEDDRRSVLVLRDMDGLDYDQIAEILKIPKGTVRSRLHRARNDLKELMSRYSLPTPFPNPEACDE